jgi:hypothetical protein
LFFAPAYATTVPALVLAACVTLGFAMLPAVLRCAAALL